MKYKISDFSKISGVSMPNLRFFEQAGLISPERGRNGYRLYSIEDAYRVNTFNSLVAQGYTLSQAAKRTEFIEPQLYAAELRANIERMQHEKELLDKRIEWTHMLEKVFSNDDYYLKTPLELRLPQLSYLPCVKGTDLSPSLSIGDKISAMVDILPFSAYCAVVRKDGDDTLGMLAETEFLNRRGISTEGMLTIPGGCYVSILSNAANSYDDAVSPVPLSTYFPYGFQASALIVYTMTETPQSRGRGFILLKTQET